jgi:hypothetical protein
MLVRMLVAINVSICGGGGGTSRGNESEHWGKKLRFIFSDPYNSFYQICVLGQASGSLLAILPHHFNSRVHSSMVYDQDWWTGKDMEGNGCIFCCSIYRTRLNIWVSSATLYGRYRLYRVKLKKMWKTILK